MWLIPENARQWVRFIAGDPRRARLLPMHLRHVDMGPLEASKPWMTFEAIEYLDRHLGASMDLFEWGSGGSTIFFAQRVRTVTAIEHDDSWGARMRQELGARGISNVNLEVIAPVQTRATGAQLNEPIRDNRPEYADLDFRAYVEAIKRWSDASLDVVVVDGRCRPACIRHATAKIKPSGLLVVDNSERAAYRDALATLVNWTSCHFFGPVLGSSLFSQTSFYTKPVT